MLNYKEGLKTKNGSSISFDTGASKKLCNGSSSGGPPTGGDPSPPKPEVPLPGSSPPKCSEASAAMNANAAAAAAAAYLAKTTEKAIHRKIGQICYDTFGNIIKVDKTPTNDIITQIKPFQKSIGQVCYDTYGNIIQTKSNGNAADADQDHANTDQEAVVTKGTKRPLSNENDNSNPSNGSTSPSSSSNGSSSSSGIGDHANSVTKTKRTKMCTTTNGIKSESLENDSDKNGNNTKEALFSSSSIDPEVAPDQLPSAAGKLFLKHLSKNNLLQKCKLPRKQFEDAISNVFKNSTITPITSSTDKNINSSNNGFVEKDFLHIQDKIMEVVFNPNINNVIELSKIHEGKAKSLAFNIRAALSVIIGRPITEDDFERKSTSNSSENEEDDISNDLSDDAKVDIKYLEVLIDMEPFGIFATLRLVLD